MMAEALLKRAEMGSEGLHQLAKGVLFVIAVVAPASLPLIVSSGAAAQQPQLQPPDPSLRPDKPHNVRPLSEEQTRTLKTQVPPAKAREKEIRHLEGERIILSVEKVCQVNQPCLLTWPSGEPIVGKYIAWSVSGIEWQAGLGWPLYRAYCPESDYDARMTFDAAKRFQIVPVIRPVSGARGVYHIECNASSWHRASEKFETWFNVNDLPCCYNDNAGKYLVTVTGWEP
jgi:hypothetical protein